MKNLRTFGAACVLALTMTVPAFAGHIHTPLEPPPTEECAGETCPATDDSLTEAALSLLQSVLALF
jgi:hypothetical protein